MKKRTMVLGGLIAAVAITGYSVSGTYAKYISESTVDGTARVAKWFTNDEKQITLFGTDYKADGTVKTATDTDAAVISSSDGNNVVGPGAHGEYMFQLTGIPEVNYRLSVNIGTPTNPFKVKVTDTTDQGNLNGKPEFNTTSNEYSPIMFSLSKCTDATTCGTSLLTDGTIGDLADKLKEIYVGTGNTQKDYKAKEALGDLGAMYKISWRWDFHETDTLASKYDTKLAQLSETLSGAEIALNISIKAEQINTAVTP